MNKSPNKSRSIFLGLLLSLSWAGTTAQAASFTKTALCAVALVGSADALSVNSPALLNPPPSFYEEGQNYSFPLFSGLLITGASPSEQIRVDLRSVDMVNFQPLDGAEFKATGPINEDAPNNAYYCIGNSSAINAMLASLTVDWLDPLYENRDRTIIAYFHNGSSFPTTPVLSGLATFMGKRKNSPPYITDGGILNIPFNGGITQPQNVAGAIGNIFSDNHDKRYNPADPGIQTIRVACSGANLAVGKTPCASPCDIPLNMFLAGMLYLEVDHQVFAAPRCTMEAIDIDPEGVNPRSSGPQDVVVIFTKPLTRFEEFTNYAKTPEGIVSIVAAPLSLLGYTKLLAESRKEIASLAAKVAKKGRINVWRFGATQANGAVQGPEVILGKYWDPKTGYDFQDLIVRIAEQVGSPKKSNEDKFSAEIAFELTKPEYGICTASRNPLRALVQAKYDFHPNQITDEKVAAIAKAVSDNLDHPRMKKPLPHVERVEVELSSIESKVDSRVELANERPSDE